MSDHLKPRLLGMLLVITAALLLADLAGSSVATAVRTASGAALGPVQRVLSGARPDEVARLSAENARLRLLLDSRTRELREQIETRDLLSSREARGHTVVLAGVVSTEVSPLGGRSVTIDVGSRDGVETDSTVVASDGLVGRVVAVSPWTSDVQVLGSSESVVAVRVGAAGLLGTVRPAPAGEGGEASGQLALTTVQPGALQVGDTVTTLGSAGGKPYAAGLTIGRVVSVDPDPGRRTVTGWVQPAVDRDAIDVVAVLVPQARDQPRPLTDIAGGTG
jgi:rod shape-determining protein MreC